MLDTVALVLDSSMFAIINYDAFRPSARGLFQPPYYTLGSRGSLQCYLNPTKTDLLSGYYYPRLTLTKRAVSGGFQITLRIEFSVPKLIYKNNFDEITEKDFNLVLEILKSRLQEKGILLRKTKLKDIPLSKIDYAKNIVLEPFSSSRQIINELNKADMSLWLDLEVAKFRNAGYGIKYRNNSFELACYDKVKDLQKGKQSDKKVEEKDNALQLSLLDEVLKPQQLEVFRVEVRLNSRLKIRQTFKSLDIDAQPIFKDIFNDQIGKQVVQHYWAVLEEAYKLAEYSPNSPSKLFSELHSNNPDARLSSILKVMGIKQLINELGVRGYRNIINNFSQASWVNSRKTLSKLSVPKTAWTPLSQVSKSLVKFEPLKLDDYRSRLYSNSKH